MMFIAHILNPVVELITAWDIALIVENQVIPTKIISTKTVWLKNFVNISALFLDFLIQV